MSTVFSFQNSNDHRSHATTIRSEQEASVSYYPSIHPDHVRFIFSSWVEHTAITYIQVSPTDGSLSKAFSSLVKSQQVINDLHLFIRYVFTFFHTFLSFLSVVMIVFFVCLTQFLLK